MKRGIRMKKRRIISFVTIVVLVCMAATYMVYAQPGTESDPVVTLSYIRDIFKPEMTFKVVEVQAGKTIFGDAGTEMILRMGKGTVIATAKGGVADLTSGHDLPKGSAIPANHHLVVPVKDGRGLKVNEKSLVMVKGGYSIK